MVQHYYRKCVSDESRPALMSGRRFHNSSRAFGYHASRSGDVFTGAS